jgi:hypothetical protein
MCYTFIVEGMPGGRMQLHKSTILTLVFFFIIVGPACAQTSQRSMPRDIQAPAVPREIVADTAFVSGADISLRTALANQRHYIYWSWLNSKSAAKSFDQDDDRKQLRQQWHDLLGVDVFMPYFKVREAEDFVTSKTKVTVFNFSGKAYFNQKRKQVEYIFKKKF